MARKAKGNTKKVTKPAVKKPAYRCIDCGTMVTMDCCGVGFTELICCGKVMEKK